MRKFLSLILTILLALLLLVSCSGTDPNVTDGKDINDSTEATEEATRDGGSLTTEKSSDESIEQTTQIVTEETIENTNLEKWYIDESSVQTVFEYGEKFNYKGIKAIHEKDGEITEYPEDDLYVERSPELLSHHPRPQYVRA